MPEQRVKFVVKQARMALAYDRARRAGLPVDPEYDPMGDHNQEDRYDRQELNQFFLEEAAANSESAEMQRWFAYERQAASILLRSYGAKSGVRLSKRSA